MDALAGANRQTVGVTGERAFLHDVLYSFG
jgi:hypothetical protein